MPAVQIRTNASYTGEAKKKLLREATRVMVEIAHKNEEAVMVTLQQVDGTMGNTADPFVFIDVRSMVGIDHRTNNDVCAALTKITAEALGASPERTYATFQQIPETCWGLSGGIAVWDAATRVWVVNGEPCK